MDINFTIVFIVILLVILISIQFTLNRIYVVLKEIKLLLFQKRNKE